MEAKALDKPTKVRILNIEIDNISLLDLLKGFKRGFIITPNVDHLIKVQKDKEFYEIYSHADYVVCDSQILYLASRLLNTPIVEKISGSDLFPLFCNFHRNNHELKIFLLGGKEGVALKAQEEINKKIGREIIVGAFSPSFGFENCEEECNDIIKMVHRSGANVLAVGVGAPKQEKWIIKYKEKMPFIQIFMAVGATLDFEAGSVSRAPKWVSKIGFEWFFRFIQEPKRLWKRYFVEDMVFVKLLLMQLLGVYKNPWKLDRK